MPVTVSFVSLGCDKNTVDSEIMLERLLENGYELVKDDALAEVIIINTCGFIQSAQEESIETILEMAAYKESGCCKKLVVTGCLAQRFAKEIGEDLPEVDAVVGTGSYEEIVEVLDELLDSDQKIVRLGALPDRDLGYQKRLLSTTGYYEYIKIAEGCDNFCTYCTIPSIRGRYRSRKAEDIIREVRDLAEQGVTELMVVAQDITKYGKDLDEDIDLSDLLYMMCRVEGIHWIRLLYCYPEDITEKLIRTMASEEKILPYIDMPIQHCSDSVLKRMNRKHSKAILQQVMDQLRDAMPEVCIRTTLITGFPGETEAEFEEMCDFVNEAGFDRLGVFTYSQEEGTPAARMKDQVPEEEKERRKDVLMQIQQQVSREISESLIGSEMEVIVEGEIPDAVEEGHVYSARSYRDAPDIDGFVFVTTEEPHQSGDYIRCRISGAYEYDLIGEEI
ncbi:MAG: 30S ribosomal protein S12 methylthiotransferase RimO [Clostridiales bacterium]|nr:30S ribosomal protein S12 methylthiotransferase RimO [Clostridiales bacterium]